jgi:hypothetical protein
MHALAGGVMDCFDLVFMMDHRHLLPLLVSQLTTQEKEEKEIRCILCRIIIAILDKYPRAANNIDSLPHEIRMIYESATQGLKYPIKMEDAFTYLVLEHLDSIQRLIPFKKIMLDVMSRLEASSQENLQRTLHM